MEYHNIRLKYPKRALFLILLIIFSFNRGYGQIKPELGYGFPNQLMAGFNYVSKNGVKKGLLIYGRKRLIRQKRRYDILGGVPKPTIGFIFQNGIGLNYYWEYNTRKDSSKIWRSSIDIGYLESGLNYMYHGSPGAWAGYSEFFEDYFNISWYFARGENINRKYLIELGPIVRFVKRHQVVGGTNSSAYYLDSHRSFVKFSVVLRLSYYLAFNDKELSLLKDLAPF